MYFSRMWAMFTARNHEFFRDRAAFGWNFAFPFLIILGFGLIFGGREYQEFKVGLFPIAAGEEFFRGSSVPPAFQNGKYLEFIPFADLRSGEEKLRHQKIDILIDGSSPTHAYWINDSSPKGYIVEQLFLASLAGKETRAEKQLIQGLQVRYIDWLFPGILAMNMMFSALWGVGYVVVRYRKNGTLKRLKATPLTPLEYLSAQMFSRIFLLMFTLAVVWLGSNLIFHFQVLGSYAALAFVFFLGGLSLCAMGLVLAARGTSEEFTSGILNFITWPMMFLSEVWFSMEGAPEWLQNLANLFPLTHLLTAARKIMNDGATLSEVSGECLIMTLVTIFCLLLAARLFSWNE